MKRTALKQKTRLKSKRKPLTVLQKFARGKDCQIRIPGICNYRTETTVLCHLNGGGAGIKHLDIHGAHGCSDCHDVVDMRNRSHDFPLETIELWFLQSVIRTQQLVVKAGLMTWTGIKDAERAA